MATLRPITRQAGTLDAASSSNAANPRLPAANRRRDGERGLLRIVSGFALFLAVGTHAAFDCKLLAGKERADRIPLIFYAAGYTLSERALYEADVDEAIAEIRKASPFREYLGHFSFYRAWTPSLRSGVLDAPSDSVFADVFLMEGAPRWNSDGFWKHYGDTAFTCAGRHQNFIMSNRGIFLLNSDASGGLTISHNWTVQSRHHWGTLIHELGHVLAGLSDEYGGYPGRPSGTWLSDGSTYGPVYNLTRSIQRDLIPWKVWIADTVPLPTPPDPQHYHDIGAFLGGDYQDTGVYHPTTDCRMLSSSLDRFCPVCREAITHRILSYTSGYFFNRIALDTVIPIPSLSRWDSTVVTGGKVVVRRIPGDTVPVSLRWRFNGGWLTGVRETLDIATLPGNGALEAILEGASPFIRNPDLVPRDTFYWSVHKSTATMPRSKPMDGIRRMGPGLFLVAQDVPVPQWARGANGKRVSLRVVARTADGWLVRGASDFGEALFLDLERDMTNSAGGL